MIRRYRYYVTVLVLIGSSLLFQVLAGVLFVAMGESGIVKCHYSQKACKRSMRGATEAHSVNCSFTDL
jgi:hypothetical protein